MIFLKHLDKIPGEYYVYRERKKAAEAKERI